MTLAVQGASIVREHVGVSADVLVYKQRCDACGHLALTNSFAIKMFAIPPGHDAWTVGDEACTMLDFSGADQYAKGASQGGG